MRRPKHVRLLCCFRNFYALRINFQWKWKELVEQYVNKTSKTRFLRARKIHLNNFLLLQLRASEWARCAYVSAQFDFISPIYIDIFIKINVRGEKKNANISCEFSIFSACNNRKWYVKISIHLYITLLFLLLNTHHPSPFVFVHSASKSIQKKHLLKKYFFTYLLDCRSKWMKKKTRYK